ncbi:hypothetical protein NUSPORA_01380 [Nucleospora cyclopteri]
MCFYLTISYKLLIIKNNLNTTACFNNKINASQFVKKPEAKLPLILLSLKALRNLKRNI